MTRNASALVPSQHTTTERKPAQSDVAGSAEGRRYAAFLDSKRQLGGDHGFEPTWLPEFLYPFQRSLVEWSVRKGRAAIFADCGLGKTPIQLVWAENVARHADKPVLIATPLAVSQQTVAEAEKFGIEAARSQDGTVPRGHRIVFEKADLQTLFFRVTLF